MIVDAHHHLWDPARRDYPWMTGDAAALRRPIGLDDLRATVEPLGVGATVAVQAASSEEETVELLALAAASDALVVGVVGWIDLTSAAAGERRAAGAGAPHPRRLRAPRRQPAGRGDGLSPAPSGGRLRAGRRALAARGRR